MESSFPTSRGSRYSTVVTAAHARCCQRVRLFRKARHTDFYLNFVLQNNSETLKHSLGQGKRIYRQDDYVGCQCVSSSGPNLSAKIHTPKMHSLNPIRKYQTNTNTQIGYKTNSPYVSQMSPTPSSSQMSMS